MAVKFIEGNRLKLLQCGRDFFPALINAIDSAQLEVQIESYIFEDDASGRPLIEALKRAAARGCAVRVLVDGFGAGEFAKHLQPEFVAAGVQALIYRRELARFSLRRQRLRRLHRKLASVDGHIAFVGGINIIDDLNNPGGQAPRLDYAVRVEGPVAQDICRVMQRLWEMVTWVSFRRRYRMTRLPMTTRTNCLNNATENDQSHGTQRAALVVRNNIRHRRAIEDAYLEAIENAREEIVIANAYFLPGFRFRHVLFAAARRGVKVTVLLQGKIEYPLQHYATQALYGAMLNVGIRIFEYQPSFLHAKVAVADGEWATVGSSNIDPFSLLLAKEANLVTLDRDFATMLRDSLSFAIANNAKELQASDWQRLSRYSKVLRWASYQLLRLAIGIAGYGGKH